MEEVSTQSKRTVVAWRAAAESPDGAVGATASQRTWPEAIPASKASPKVVEAAVADKVPVAAVAGAVSVQVTATSPPPARVASPRGLTPEARTKPAGIVSVAVGVAAAAWPPLCRWKVTSKPAPAATATGTSIVPVRRGGEIAVVAAVPEVATAKACVERLGGEVPRRVTLSTRVPTAPGGFNWSPEVRAHPPASP